MGESVDGSPAPPRAEAEGSATGGAAPPAWRPGFNEFLLAGIVALMLVGAGLSFVLYALPVPHLQLAELQPSFRIAHTVDFPVAESRVVHWGDRVVLVIRTGEDRYAALEGVSPIDGCILEWDPASVHVRSPCTDLQYDLHGNVVRGLTTVPLQRYAVFVRQGVAYLTAP